MIQIKDSDELAIMRAGGKISKEILDYGLSLCVEGVSTKHVDALIDEKISSMGVKPWFKNIDNYPYASCISVNDVWIHGFPNDIKLKKWDVVSIDLGITYKGYNLDNCWTVVVQGEEPTTNIRSQFNHEDKKIEQFLIDGVDIFMDSIKAAKIGGRLGDISATMGNESKSKGYSVIKDFTGHGIGKRPHEDPAIPCYGSYGAGPLLQKGMVLAIELMYTIGGSDYTTADDGWTILTADGAISAMFEHTVALGNEGVEILTA